MVAGEHKLNCRSILHRNNAHPRFSIEGAWTLVVTWKITPQNIMSFLFLSAGHWSVAAEHEIQEMSVVLSGLLFCI